MPIGINSPYPVSATSSTDIPEIHVRIMKSMRHLLESHCQKNLPIIPPGYPTVREKGKICSVAERGTSLRRIESTAEWRWGTQWFPQRLSSAPQEDYQAGNGGVGGHVKEGN